MNHSYPGNSRAQIDHINFGNLKDRKSMEQYFGEDNFVLNGLLTENVSLSRSLNYQPPSVSVQQILDIIPSQNSEFALITKPNGIV
jgi:hypothetical protein